MSLLLILLIIILVLCLGGGYWAGPTYGPWSWSPLFLLLVVFVVLLALGVVHL